MIRAIYRSVVFNAGFAAACVFGLICVLLGVDDDRLDEPPPEPAAGLPGEA
jgi:hypothetical protein